MIPPRTANERKVHTDRIRRLLTEMDQAHPDDYFEALRLAALITYRLKQITANPPKKEQN